MERRNFFKSLGLLSLAAVIPKFLLGSEKEKPKNTRGFSIVKSSRIELDSKVAIDRAILPKNMTISDWNEFYKNGMFYYSSKVCGLKPKEFRDMVILGDNPFLKVMNLGNDHNIYLEHRSHVCGLTFFDVDANKFVDERGFTNYMSIERNYYNSISVE